MYFYIIILYIDLFNIVIHRNGLLYVYIAKGSNNYYDHWILHLGT